MRLAIDLRSPVPSYQQLAGQLRDAIASGEIQPGEPLPSITSLVQETGLSVGTVRHALQVLAGEGTITIVPGRGSYARLVAPQQVCASLIGHGSATLSPSNFRSKYTGRPALMLVGRWSEAPPPPVCPAGAARRPRGSPRTTTTFRRFLVDNYSDRYPMPLAPGSMGCGNTVSTAHAEASMTAPGSESVNPIPDRVDNAVPVLGEVTGKYRDNVTVRG